MDWEAYILPLFTGVFALTAIVSLGVSLWSLGWPSVKGVVEVSLVDKETGWTADSTDSGTTVYQKDRESFALAYSYEAKGMKYLGSNIKPWGNPDWNLRTGGSDLPDSGKVIWSGARDLAQWYRPGVIVDVYYCPLRPQWSCLEPGGFLVPVILLAFAAFLYFVALR